MDTRILLFTGKGGVGKTTCAAATALRAAEQGRRVLVLSSDPAHSLADALDAELGPEPVTVAPRLDAQEVDLYYSMRKYWGHMRELMLLVFRWQGMNTVAAEELAAIPGMAEASALLWLDQFYASDDYDLIVVDSAPTGETLTFLSLPQVTEWWLTKAFPFQKLAISTLGAAVRKTTGVPLDRAYRELQVLFDKLRGIQRVLSDPAVSSIRLVMNPERMVLREAQRAYAYLQLYGYNVDAAVVNRILPADAVSRDAWGTYLDAQKTYLDEIEHTFAPLPILRVPHLRREVFGLELLRGIGDDLYGERDPAAVYHREPTWQLHPEGDGYRLDVRLPLADADVDAKQYGDQLVLRVDGQRRHYPLPHFLSLYHLSGTRLADGWLHVDFAPAPEA